MNRASDLDRSLLTRLLALACLSSLHKAMAPLALAPVLLLHRLQFALRLALALSPCLLCSFSLSSFGVAFPRGASVASCFRQQALLPRDQTGSKSIPLPRAQVH